MDVMSGAPAAMMKTCFSIRMEAMCGENRGDVGGAWVLVSVLVLGLPRMLSQSLYFLLFFNVKE